MCVLVAKQLQLHGIARTDDVIHRNGDVGCRRKRRRRAGEEVVTERLEGRNFRLWRLGGGVRCRGAGRRFRLAVINRPRFHDVRLRERLVGFGAALLLQSLEQRVTLCRCQLFELLQLLRGLRHCQRRNEEQHCKRECAYRRSRGPG